MVLDAAGNIGGNASFVVEQGGAFAVRGEKVVSLGAVDVEENAIFSAIADRKITFTGAVDNAGDFVVNADTALAFAGNVTNEGTFLANAGTALSFRGVDNNGVFVVNAGTALAFAGNVVNAGGFVADAGTALSFRGVDNSGEFDVDACTALAFAGNVINAGDFDADAGTALSFRGVDNDVEGDFYAFAGTSLAFTGNVANAGRFVALAGDLNSGRGNITFRNVVNEGDFGAVATNVLRVVNFVQDNGGASAGWIGSVDGPVSVSKVQVADGNELFVVAGTSATISKLENAGTATVAAGKLATVGCLTGDVGVTTLSADRVVLSRADGQAVLNIVADNITTGRLNNLGALTLTDDLDEPGVPSRFTVVRGLGVDDITIGDTQYIVRDQYVNRSAVALTRQNFERFLEIN